MYRWQKESFVLVASIAMNKTNPGDFFSHRLFLPPFFLLSSRESTFLFCSILILLSALMFESADVINASDVDDIGAGQYLLVVFVIGVVVVSSVYFIFALNVELYRSFAHFMKVRRKVKAEKKAGTTKKKKTKKTKTPKAKKKKKTMFGFGSKQSHVSDDNNDNGGDGVGGDGSASVSSSFFSGGPESKGSGEGGKCRSGSEIEYRSNPLRSPLRLRKAASTAGGGGVNDDPSRTPSSTTTTTSSGTTGSTTSDVTSDAGSAVVHGSQDGVGRLGRKWQSAGDPELRWGGGGDGERPTSEHINPLHLAVAKRASSPRNMALYGRMQKHTSSQRHASSMSPSATAAKMAMMKKHSSVTM